MVGIGPAPSIGLLEAHLIPHEPIRKSAIPMLRQWAPTERRLWEMNFRKFSTIQEAHLDFECRIVNLSPIRQSSKPVSASEGFGGTQ